MLEAVLHVTLVDQAPEHRIVYRIHSIFENYAILRDGFISNFSINVLVSLFYLLAESSPLNLFSSFLIDYFSLVKDEFFGVSFKFQCAAAMH